ncbi:hypothetical protein FAI41_03425 [Acetobacteraceae bacterium]|nr:hypothetical protein FAI41_03425 [Acetobacteraceae bacterium]
MRRKFLTQPQEQSDLFSFLKGESFVRFGLFSLIIGLFIWPIIHAGVFFADDYQRALEGNVSMATCGRYLAELFLISTSFSPALYSVAPLFQMLSVPVLAFALMQFSFALAWDRRSSLLVLPFIVCTPFFLQNLSYCFDAITMSLALACAIFPFCFQGKYKYGFATFSLLVCLNFYQAALNSFFILLVLLSLMKLLEKKEEKILSVIVFFSKYLLLALFALVLYKIENFLLFPLLAGDHAREYAVMSLSPASLCQAVEMFWHYCFVECNKGLVAWILSFAVICGLGRFFYRLVTLENKKEALCASFLALFLLFFAFISIAGPMALLAKPLIVPRVMIGMGAFIALGMTFLVHYPSSFKGFEKCAFALAGISMLGVMVGAFAYGSALGMQTKYEEQLRDHLAEDLYALHVTTDHLIVGLLLFSKPPLAPYVKNTLRSFPWILNDLGDRVGNPDPILWPLPYQLIEAGLPEAIEVIAFVPEDWESDAKSGSLLCRYSHKIMRRFYTIYQRDNHVLVDFNQRKCLAIEDFQKG